MLGTVNNWRNDPEVTGREKILKKTEESAYNDEFFELLSLVCLVAFIEKGRLRKLSEYRLLLSIKTEQEDIKKKRKKKKTKRNKLQIQELFLSFYFNRLRIVFLSSKTHPLYPKTSKHGVNGI